MPEPAPPDLTLYAESTWMSPWVLHAMVALEEKRLPYKLETAPLPMPSALKDTFRAHATTGKVPILVHGATWISESLAISEYLAEAFPMPGYPRIFPANLAERARARQMMLYLRTGLFALREARPTSTVYRGQPTTTPLSDKAREEAAELERIALAVIPEGRTTMCTNWCVADCDLGLALMRLVANRDPLDPRLVDYARAQFERPSTRKFLSHIPPSH